MRIAFIGGGTMAEAIVSRLLEESLVTPSDVAVGEPLEARRDYLGRTYGVGAGASNRRAAEGADVVVLAVKPQDLGGVMRGMEGALAPGQVVVSIVAGARLGALRKGLGHPLVIRVMPNTAAQVGAAMSVWTASPEVPPEGVEAARALLQAIGQEMYVADEHYLEMATALSASGPAFVMLFLEAMVDAGVHVGLPRQMAATLAGQTLLGSALLSSRTGRHPAELRNMVTSPGGTTTEGLLALEEAGLRAGVMRAVQAAYEKSLLLGEMD